MLDYFHQIVLAQFEASLAMLWQCIEQCPDEEWEGKIAQLSVRQVAYHTLFFVDYYLGREQGFELRELHHTGGDEREPVNSPGISREATLEYLTICLEKLRATLPTETEETLRGPAGFSWLKFSRGELHLYNLRHVQHHTGQLSAHLRRVVPACRDPELLRWVRSGWR